MKGRRIARSRAADRDVELAAAHIAEHNPRAADRFIDAVRATEEALLRAPGMGTRRDYDNRAPADMRFHLVKGFRK